MYYCTGYCVASRIAEGKLLSTVTCGPDEKYSDQYKLRKGNNIYYPKYVADHDHSYSYS